MTKITAAQAARLLPKRPKNANKTDFGHVLVAGGARRMEGAAVLAATAAARSGAGYVSVCSPVTIAFDRKRPDFLTLPWPAIRSADLEAFDAIVVGPGLGVDVRRFPILERLIESRRPLVIDADALTLIAAMKDVRLHGDCVLTPHAGELSRLIGWSAKKIGGDREGAAKAAAEKFGGVVLLKGPRTLIHDGRKAFVNSTGNDALAKAGTGDVLSGFIAAWIAQGLAVREAAVLAAYLHGAIADDWIKVRDPRTFMASDMADLLSAALKKLKAAR